MSRAARGAALLLVMWLVLLLAGLVAGYATAARVESMQGNGVVRHLAAREAARAGIEYAAARMLDADPRQRWSADGRAYRFAFDGAQVEVALRDEAGKIDLNAADHRLLSGLFIAVGEPRDAAEQLAGAIIDWRDEDSLLQPAGGAEDPAYASAGLAWGAKDASFETVAELLQVLGMRPALYASVEPYLTVYSGNGTPDPRSADGIVLQAMGAERPQSLGDDAAPLAGSGTYSIDSRARLADGRSAHVSVTLRLGGNGLPGSVYTPLRWQDGAIP